MSYLRRLDQARSRLGDGQLLAAEQELREATREWKESKLRVPLVERGLEPALRTLGRVFGRRSEEPVLPIFSRRADLLREDLHAFARALLAEIIEDVADERLDPERRHTQATEALSLDRGSEFFELSPARKWEVVKVWLTDGRHIGSSIRAELLPAGAPPPEDAQWWLEWLEEWCASPSEPVRAFADWGRRLAVHHGSGVVSELDRWSWVEARLAMLDPLAASQALAPAERVIATTPDQQLARSALESWAELVTNFRLLATPGGNPRDLLEARSMDAARLGLVWPPPSVLSRLPERRPSGQAPVFVGVQAQDDGAAIAFVLHDGRRACDVLCIKPSAEPDPSDPFAMDEAGAQRRIAAWVPPDAILLSAGEPGPRLRGLVGASRWIPVEQLRELFGGGSRDMLPAAPVSTHPAWTREVCAPWDSLVPAARRLVPGLEDLLSNWPSLATPWGRDNLRRLASRGVSLAEALADAAALIATPDHDGLVRTAPPLGLAWPHLAERPWPERGQAPSSDHEPVGVGRVWIDRRADPAELAAVAADGGFANLLCSGEDRVYELASAVAAATDAVRVAVVGPEVPCVSPLLDLLNRWISESPGDLERGRAAVWLLSVLSESAGPIEPLLARSGEPGLVAEVRATLATCSGDCGSHPEGACWPDQFRERVHLSHVAVIDVAEVQEGIPQGRRTVVDDLRSWVVGASDSEAQRRLEFVPSGGESVVVFTPGLGFLERSLGGIPTPGGTHGDWLFVEESPGPSVWAAPPGYGPASELLARESRALVEERVRRWFSDLGDAPIWVEGRADRATGLVGVASAPSKPTVLVTSLGMEAGNSPLLLGLRVAAAASHATRRVVCLSPALAEALKTGGGMLWGEDDPSLPRALDAGSMLLSGRRGRPHATWTSPLTRPRLEQVGATRARDLATSLQPWSSGRARILAGVPESDRDATVELICRLQAEALDGGPLGVRAVVVVVPWMPEAAGTLEVRFRKIDRARELSIEVGVEEIHAAVVEDWARRNPSVAWVFRNSECAIEPDRRDALKHVFAALRRSQARALFFTDHVAEARSLRELISPHLAVDSVAVIDEYPEGLDPMAWDTRTLGSLDAHCPQCDGLVAYRNAFEICPECGVPVDAVASARRALRVAFESRVIAALRQLGPQAGWTMLVFDKGRQSRLRQRLGLSEGLGDAPLLAGTGSSPSAEVMVPEDLWRRKPLQGPLIVCGLPSGVDVWRNVDGRLRARGVLPGEWWLGPPGLDESEPLPAADARFSIPREEVLERFSIGEDPAAAGAALGRLEAAGGSWDSTPVLRVHELVRRPGADDAPLAGLARATAEGWAEPGAVVGLRPSAPARVERAVRTGQRLPHAPFRPLDDLGGEPARFVGVAGWGKTTALTELASRSADLGEAVLVLVPDPTGRLEWIERTANPTITCLDLDEFLLDFLTRMGAPGASRLRVLPPADRVLGEQVRLALVARVSELYAVETGELPGVDSRTIVRALEGERLAPDPRTTDSRVESGLLQSCVERARMEEGWMGSRDLLQMARALPRPESAYDRYAIVLVDDAHDLPDMALEFLEGLFGSRLRGYAIDPVLGAVPESEIDDGAMESQRFGNEIAGAIERIWRATTPLPAPVRGRRSLRSVAESDRILALTTAIERIAGELAEVDEGDRVAIVAASERDRRMMERQLSVRGIAVDGADRDLADLVTGPREIMAALAWVAGEEAETGEKLLEVILAAGPEPAERTEAAHYEARLRRRLSGETVEVLDRVEAFLLPLVLIRSALGSDTRVDRAVEVLLDCGLLNRLTWQPAMDRRIEALVRQYRGLSVAELLESVRVDRVLRPSTGGAKIRILAPDQLSGRSFDVIHYVCTGFEAPERHYRVISRARMAVKIACSEVDLLQA